MFDLVADLELSLLSTVMASRKSQKAARESAIKESPLDAIIIDDEADLLPAAVRFARELCGARPNDPQVELAHENYRNGRYFIKLRFPNKETREVRFSKFLLCFFLRNYSF